MRLIHTADLHIGKTIHNFSMLPDQKKMLEEMAELAQQYKVQAFVISGDIYDRAVPPAEAVSLFNHFLTTLQKMKIDIFMISGNHDSPERIAFAEQILEHLHVHIAGEYQTPLKRVIMEDEYGPIEFTLMPYVKPQILGLHTCQEAVDKMLLESVNKKIENPNRRVLLTHYFVTNAGSLPQQSDSECPVLVGGIDAVDCSSFREYSYVALGHIHKHQMMNGEEVKKGEAGPVVYAGSPLAYSFSECGQKKSVTLLTLGQDEAIQTEQLYLHPLHEMKKLSGRLEDLLSPDVYEKLNREDYYQIMLTDEDECIDPIGSLRSVYPNVMQLLFEKHEKKEVSQQAAAVSVREKTTMELFEDFYMEIRDKEMDEQRKKVLEEVIEQLK